MNLAETIDHALELTIAMQEALQRDDPLAAMEVLPVRSLAMGRFQDAHREASHSQKIAQATKIQKLKQLDEQLQSEAGHALQTIAKSLREGPNNTTSRSEQSTCLTGCLDRRA